LGHRVAERRIPSRPIVPDSGISNIPDSVYYTLAIKSTDKDYRGESDMRKQLLAIIACTVTTYFLQTSIAHASAISDIEAVVKWDTFLLDFESGVSINWVWQGNTTSVDASSSQGADSDTDFSSEWLLPVSSSASVTDSQGTSTINSTELKTTATANRATPIPTWGFAGSSAWRQGNFTVSGEGWIYAKVDYEITLKTLQVTEEEVYAAAVGIADIYLSNYTLDQMKIDTKRLFEEIDGIGSVPGYSLTGTLEVTQQFHNGDSGGISIASHAAARVDEPSVVGLVFLGFILLLTKPRRMKKPAWEKRG
jgi:hypothetical protein